MHVTTEWKPEGFAVVTMCREPVNSMNLQLWTELLDTLEVLEADPSVRGVIFYSGLTRDIFSAGNDIMELFAPRTSLDKYKKFWRTQNVFLARLYSSPLITVAAIRGACPAGGCILALCCDYRVMTDFGNIGLNEVDLGIPVPILWAKVMGKCIGHGVTYNLLQEARMVNSQEAHKLGLVHEIVGRGNLFGSAEKWMKKMLLKPDAGRQVTKQRMRKSLSQEIIQNWESEAEEGWQLLTKPAVIDSLAAVMQRLSKGKAKL